MNNKTYLLFFDKGPKGQKTEVMNLLPVLFDF